MSNAELGYHVCPLRTDQSWERFQLRWVLSINDRSVEGILSPEDRFGLLPDLAANVQRLNPFYYHFDGGRDLRP